MNAALTQSVNNVLDRTHTRDADEKILRLGFGYPGNKLALLDEILPHIPYDDVYVEPCGGSGAVLLNRKPSKLDVFNDRCSGVTALYRCIHNRKLLTKLQERLDTMIYSKEEFFFCRDSWEEQHDDLVERAARWFYTIHCSFGSKGRMWGSCRQAGGQKYGRFGKIAAGFELVHERMRDVQIDNIDLFHCIEKYDSPHTVWYIDPTYLNGSNGVYRNELTLHEHERLVERVFNMQGFVALSGYANPTYDSMKWDDRQEFTHRKKMTSGVTCESNNFQGLELGESRAETTEVLWIKDYKH